MQPGSTIEQMVSRSEGYRRGAGKEQLSIDVLQEFLRDKLGRCGVVIDGQEDNYRHGDLRFPCGTTIECKGQPIDPFRYEQNFVELFESTQSDRHLGGLQRFADLLHLELSDIIHAKVRFRGSIAQVGELKRVSVSITSMESAAFTAYVNYMNGGQHIYIYERDEILSNIRSGLKKGLVRGAGNSNEDTYAVFIPLPRMRWARNKERWAASGSESEIASISRLADALE